MRYIDLMMRRVHYACGMSMFSNAGQRGSYHNEIFKIHLVYSNQFVLSVQ